MGSIVGLIGREILDSRGYPTVEAEVTLSSGVVSRASVPSGASTGSREAIELRDGTDRFDGKGVLKAVKNVNTEIYEAIVGMDVNNQTLIDETMIRLDGTVNKSRLGANAILAVSLSVMKAAAKASGLPAFRYMGGAGPMTLPVPLMNVINGGAHANNSLDIQEFMVVPAGFDSFREALRSGVEIFHSIKTILEKNGLSTAVGDEGGFAPNLKNSEEALDLIVSGVESAGYRIGEDIFIGLDCASSEFFDGSNYILKGEGKTLDRTNFSEYLKSLVNKYPILSIEDGMAENDWKGWRLLTDNLGEGVQLVGDDLFVTNVKILEEGINMGVANSILIKVNQIGTLTETFSAIQAAKSAGYTTIVSHRSGETEDVTIADLSVASNAMQIKTGSLSRSDRIAKYNELLRIEESFSEFAKYAGKKAFPKLS